MRKRGYLPTLDPLETRLALSTATIPTPVYREAKVEITHVLATLARTGNLDRASAAITRIAARFPFADDLLLPVWKAELTTVSRGTALKARREMFATLNTHLHRGMDSGTITVKGPVAGPLARLHGSDRIFEVANLTSIDITISMVQRENGRVVSKTALSRQSSFRSNLPGSREGYFVEIFADGKTYDVDVGIPYGKVLVCVNGLERGTIETELLAERF